MTVIIAIAAAWFVSCLVSVAVGAWIERSSGRVSGTAMLRAIEFHRQLQIDKDRKARPIAEAPKQQVNGKRAVALRK